MVAMMKPAWEQPLPLMECGVSALTLPGEDESGDLHLVQPFPGGMLLAVVDGSGHGSEAASAARIAISTLRQHACEGVITLVRRCHEQLKGTRGVVMSLASFNGVENTMTWLGVGNIEGLLLRSGPSLNPSQEALLMRAGVVGYRLPPLQGSVVPIAPDDLLVFTTDGIRCDFAGEFSTDDAPDRIAEYISTHHGKGTDDGLVLVARYLGWSS
jgi:phosphoserine phosphatase RsbX